jgi:tetratricopeptide (TPR) repeat protein
MRLVLARVVQRLVVLAFLALALPDLVAAQGSALDMEARALFDAGRVAFVDERYDDALGYFQRAHELSGRDELLYNIASALDRLDRDPEALVQYEAFLTAVPDAENRTDVELRVRLLRERLTRDEDAAASAAAASAAAASAAAATSTATTATTASATRPEVPSGTSSDHTSRPTEGRTIRVGDPVVDATPAAGGDVTSEAWFWVLIGAVAVGAGVGITVGVLASQDPGEGPYVTGPDGRVIMTLQGTLP